MPTLTLRNQQHGTHTTLRVPGLPATLTRGQVLRARAALCPRIGCPCSSGALREAGPQDVRITQNPLTHAVTITEEPKP
ncbi:MAG: hypothetical protein ACYCOU_01215 [Sulfobacillus sp.]